MDGKLDGVGLGTNQATPDAPTGQANINVPMPDHMRLALEYLSARGIPPEVADAAHVYPVADTRAELGSEFSALPAIVFPYFNFDGEPDWVEIDGRKRSSSEFDTFASRLRKASSNARRCGFSN